MEKPPLPIKTKIAAWWMIITGGVGVCFFIRVLAEPGIFGGEPFGEFFQFLLLIIFGPIFIVWGGLFLSGGIFLLKRKRRCGWWLSVIVLSLTVLILIVLWKLVLPPLILIIPLILLLLDRKNFWKIAS